MQPVLARPSPEFYLQPALRLAPLLLGKALCRRLEDGEVLRRRITETEAYCGESDTACHARNGKTPRNSVMYETGGRAYIYLCYGIHHLLNVVCAPAGQPEAVLLRGVEGFSGPGRLTKALRIGRALNGVDLITSDVLWLEDGGGGEGGSCGYVAAPRVGIDYAAPEDRAALRRFILSEE